ncbi:hypothetical protein MMC08_005019 [Neofusicoccum parvum]|nr:hypothetical protein MMC08_005019 [Neofusicoccum parvum]
MVQLADEWLQLEAAMGARPRLLGRDIFELRDHAAAMAAQVPKPEPSEALRIHGGGWCVGDLDTDDGLVRHMAEKVPMTFISVDYRLAPEHPWPASLVDCAAVAKWALDEFAPGRNVDVAPGIVLAGTSAGGQLAFATASKLIEDHYHVRGIASLAPLTITPKAVPVHMKGKYTSMVENADTALVDPANLQIFLDATGHADGDTSFCVLRSQNLHKFPPTYLVTCGADVLRDDGILMEEALREHG